MKKNQIRRNLRSIIPKFAPRISPYSPPIIFTYRALSTHPISLLLLAYNYRAWIPSKPVKEELIEGTKIPGQNKINAARVPTPLAPSHPQPFISRSSRVNFPSAMDSRVIYLATSLFRLSNLASPAIRAYLASICIHYARRPLARKPGRRRSIDRRRTWPSGRRGNSSKREQGFSRVSRGGGGEGARKGEQVGRAVRTQMEGDRKSVV